MATVRFTITLQEGQDSICFSVWVFLGTRPRFAMEKRRKILYVTVIHTVGEFVYTATNSVLVEQLWWSLVGKERKKEKRSLFRTNLGFKHEEKRW